MPAAIWSTGGRAYPSTPLVRNLAEPARDPLHRLAHIVGRTGVAEADEGATMKRIEVDARGRRDMGLLEHGLGEVKTVRSEIGDVGVKIERTIGRQKSLQAGARQPLDQDATVLQIA